MNEVITKSNVQKRNSHVVAQKNTISISRSAAQKNTIGIPRSVAQKNTISISRSVTQKNTISILHSVAQKIDGKLIEKKSPARVTASEKRSAFSRTRICIIFANGYTIDYRNSLELLRNTKQIVTNIINLAKKVPSVKNVPDGITSGRGGAKHIDR
jgi:hypothetical protein